MSLLTRLKSLFTAPKPAQPMVKPCPYRDIDGRFVELPKAMRQVILLNREVWLDIKMSAQMDGVTIQDVVCGNAPATVSHLKRFLRKERGIRPKQLRAMFGGVR